IEHLAIQKKPNQNVQRIVRLAGRSAFANRREVIDRPNTGAPVDGFLGEAHALKERAQRDNGFRIGRADGGGGGRCDGGGQVCAACQRPDNEVAGWAMDWKRTSSAASCSLSDASGMIPRSSMRLDERSVRSTSAHGLACTSPFCRRSTYGRPVTSRRDPGRMRQPAAEKDCASKRAQANAAFAHRNSRCSYGAPNSSKSKRSHSSPSAP